MMRRKHFLLASGSLGPMTTNEARLGRYIRDGEGHPPAPAPAPAPTPQEEADAAFDAAFAENAAETPPTETPPAETPPAETPPAETPPAEAPPAETPPAETPPAETPPAETPPAPEPKPEAKGLNAEDVLSRLAELVKPGEAPPAGAAAEETTTVYTPDELATLEEYHKNWGDVAKGEALMRKAEYADMFKFIFTEVAGYVAPLFDAQKAIGNTLHTSELKELVPDYSPDLETAVGQWVETLPPYLQEPFKGVMKSGTSEEVADLIGRYRTATGTQAPPAAPAAAAPAVPPPPAKTELSSAAKQAADALAPVSGDRSAVPQGEDTQDFDTAFSRYAAAGD
jgi:hypothetical protein